MKELTLGLHREIYKVGNVTVDRATEVPIQALSWSLALM